MTGNKTNGRAVEFVFEWKKRAEKQQGRYVILSVGSMFLVFVACICTFFWFQQKNYQRIVNQNMEYVQDSAIQKTNQVEREMANTVLIVESLASQYASLEKNSKDMSIMDKLYAIWDERIFDRIAYVDKDGNDTSITGNAQIGDRSYFKNAISGKSGWELLEKSRVTGSSAIVFYAPIKENGVITGVMLGFYEKNNLKDLFLYELFNYNPISYISLGDGTVVASSEEFENGSRNLLEELKTKHYTGKVDYDEIQEVIEDNERTTITFSYTEKNKTTVGVIVQFNNSDCMYVSYLPNDVTHGMVKNANRIGTILLAIIIAVFAVFVVVLVFFIRKLRSSLEQEMEGATDNLQKTIKEEERQLAIIESLSEIYTSIYYVNVTTKRYIRIKLDSLFVTTAPSEGDVREAFQRYIEKYVDASEKERMEAFLDVDTFVPRLTTYGIDSIEYKRRNDGWRRGVLVPSKRDANGNILSVIYAVQPIDAEKKVELETKKALQEAYEAANVANKAKTTFLSNMSHDIRTPMNAIVGYTAIAASNIEDRNKVSDCLKKITISSKHLLGLINEVLDMSKIESGSVDLCEEEFNLSELVDSLISINQSLIKEKNHSLVVKINNLNHENVIGDSTRLQQVFTNLLSNAIKYTPENGKIEILISEKETNKTNIGWYEFVFKDNGIGMSEDFVKKLFEPFTRAEDDRILDIQGTGLGMPIAKNIINMMNGDITVESELNKGTTFTVSFILRLQPTKEVDYKAFVDLPVLVVDDEVVICESTSNMLNDIGMNSEWVTSGREAVAKTVERHEADNDYYAVLIDWKMPDMNGIETTREIRKLVGDEVPIIVISAYDWTDIEKEARDAGVNAFLSKPLFKSRVVNLFSELIGNKPSEDNKEDTITSNDFSGNRILLVEDNEINREIATEILSMMGLEVESAENGKIAIEKFEASPIGYYDLIFMDIQMPVMNGYETTKGIRTLTRFDADSVPIIAMSANAFSSDVRKSFSAGMNGHIAKPIDVKKVMSVLRENLKK